MLYLVGPGLGLILSGLREVDVGSLNLSQGNNMPKSTYFLNGNKKKFFKNLNKSKDRVDANYKNFCGVPILRRKLHYHLKVP